MGVKPQDLEEPIHEFLASLQQIQKSYAQHQHRFSKLESELTLDLENLRSCAIDYFSKGQYNECARLLSFLGKIEDHENLEQLFDIGRRSLELEDTGSDSLEQTSFQVLRFGSRIATLRLLNPR